MSQGMSTSWLTSARYAIDIRIAYLLFLHTGPSPASEPETQAIQNAAKDLSAKIKVWISYHGSRSYNVILSPFAWTCDELPEDSEDMNNASLVAIKAVQREFNDSRPGEHAYWRTGGLSNIKARSHQIKLQRTCFRLSSDL